MVTTPQAAPFDPVTYKLTTHAQWQEAAEAWHRWGPVLEDWLGDATEMMLELAGLTQGQKVLDVAAGAGGQSIAAARRVGPTGSVLVTDISENILGFAEVEASKTGLTNIATRVMDGENLEVEEGFFDAVISRLGLIYFPDHQAALTNAWRALKPNGKMAAIVYSTPERDKFFSIPVSNNPDPGPTPTSGTRSARPLQPRLSRCVAAGICKGRIPRRQDHERGRALAACFGIECVRFEKESFGALHQSSRGSQSKSANRRGRKSRSNWRGSMARTGSRVPAS